MNRRSATKIISALPLVIHWPTHAYSSEKQRDIEKLVRLNFKNKPVLLTKDIKILFTDKLKESVVLKDCVLRGAYLRVTVKSNINNISSLTLMHEPDNQNICSFRLTRNCLPVITISIRSFKPGNLIAAAETSEAIYYNYSYISHSFSCYQGG